MRFSLLLKQTLGWEKRERQREVEKIKSDKFSGGNSGKQRGEIWQGKGVRCLMQPRFIMKESDLKKSKIKRQNMSGVVLPAPISCVKNSHQMINMKRVTRKNLSIEIEQQTKPIMIFVHEMEPT